MRLSWADTNGAVVLVGGLVFGLKAGAFGLAAGQAVSQQERHQAEHAGHAPQAAAGPSDSALLRERPLVRHVPGLGAAAAPGATGV